MRGDTATPLDADVNPIRTPLNESRTVSVLVPVDQQGNYCPVDRKRHENGRTFPVDPEWTRFAYFQSPLPANVGELYTWISSFTAGFPVHGSINASALAQRMGCRRSVRCRGPQNGTIEDTPTRLCCLDVDKGAVCPDHIDPCTPAAADWLVREHLRIPAGVGAVVQWSGSASPTNAQVKAHVWLLLERPLDYAGRKAFGRRWGNLIDERIFVEIQPIYSLPPTPDPLGAARTVALPGGAMPVPLEATQGGASPSREIPRVTRAAAWELCQRDVEGWGAVPSAGEAIVAVKTQTQPTPASGGQHAFMLRLISELCRALPTASYEALNKLVEQAWGAVPGRDEGKFWTWLETCFGADERLALAEATVLTAGQSPRSLGATPELAAQSPIPEISQSEMPSEVIAGELQKIPGRAQKSLVDLRRLVKRGLEGRVRITAPQVQGVLLQLCRLQPHSNLRAFVRDYIVPGIEGGLDERTVLEMLGRARITVQQDEAHRKQMAGECLWLQTGEGAQGQPVVTAVSSSGALREWFEVSRARFCYDKPSWYQCGADGVWRVVPWREVFDDATEYFRWRVRQVLGAARADALSIKVMSRLDLLRSKTSLESLFAKPLDVHWGGGLHPEWLPMPSGPWDLRAGAFARRGYDPEWMVRYTTPRDLWSPEPTDEVFGFSSRAQAALQWLLQGACGSAEAPDDAQAALMRAGRLLWSCAHMTIAPRGKEAKLFIFSSANNPSQANGSNGKSTIRSMLIEMLGEELHKGVSAEILRYSNRDKHTSRVGRLSGAHVSGAEEAEGMTLNSEMLKSVLAQSLQAQSGMGKDFETLPMGFDLLFCSNEELTMHRDMQANHDRVVICEFLNSFARDVRRGRELREQHLQGFAEMVLYYAKTVLAGEKIPSGPHEQELQAEMFAESRDAKLERFLDEHVDLEAPYDAWTTSAQLLQAFRDWNAENDHRIPQAALHSHLKRVHRMQAVRSQQGGVRLRGFWRMKLRNSALPF